MGVKFKLSSPQMGVTSPGSYGDPIQAFVNSGSYGGPIQAFITCVPALARILWGSDSSVHHPRVLFCSNSRVGHLRGASQHWEARRSTRILLVSHTQHLNQMLRDRIERLGFVKMAEITGVKCSGTIKPRRNAQSPSV